MRVIAAMSGGVDSAVAAARADDAGHEVTGIHLALSRNPQSHRTGARGCCTIEDANDARRAADVIGIPFYVWDLSERFHEDVVEDFVAEYAAGRTPNPCLRCNEKIKFAAVLDRALALGFDAVATGHYARLVDGADGTVEMHRAVDPGKDQSYVLGVLTQRAAGALALPARRHTARRPSAPRRRRAACWWRRSPTATTSASSADGDTAGWLQDKLGDGAGDVRRRGRRGRSARTTARSPSPSASAGACGIGRPAADGKPRYVLDIEPVSGTVTVGPREALTVDRLTRSRGPLVRSGAPRAAGVHRAAAGPRRRAPGGRDGRRRRVSVALLDPAQGIAPGQAAVVYDGTRVVGSCTITATSRASAAR